MKNKALSIASLAVASVIIRLPTLSIPFERDEGEFAYMGQLILKGIPPFAFEGNMKLPGAYFFYALIMQLFGSSVFGVHIGLILCNFSSSVLVFLVGKILFKEDKILPAFTALSYLIMAAHYSVLGFALHATQILIPFVLLAFYSLLRFQNSNDLKWLFLSGITFACAVIIKQPAFLFGLIYFSLFINNARVILKRLAVVITGFLIPFSLVLIWALAYNLQDNIITWVFTYALEYGTDHTWRQVLSNGYNHTLDAVSIFWLIWIMAYCGLVYTMLRFKQYYIMILFAAGAILSVIPGFFFRPHYYVMLLPAISLFAGILIQLTQQLLHIRIAQALMLITVLFFTRSIVYNYKASHHDILRREYEIAPFAEAEKIGQFVANHSAEGDRILVFGSEPQIYFHANRRAACGFLYFWPFVENHSLNVKMQQLAIAQIDSLEPSIIVFTQRVSWDVFDDSPKQLFNWMDDYIQHYDKIGLIDVFPNKETVYSWEEDRHSLNPEGKYYLEVYARKD